MLHAVRNGHHGSGRLALDHDRREQTIFDTGDPRLLLGGALRAWSFLRRDGIKPPARCDSENRTKGYKKRRSFFMFGLGAGMVSLH